MDISGKAIHHIAEIAKVPSFSSYEERLHPYITSVFEALSGTRQIESPGNNLLFRLGNTTSIPKLAMTAHLDKINHFGKDHPDELPVSVTDCFIEGAMDDSAGIGILLALAEAHHSEQFPDMLFFLSEMEESHGLKKDPYLLKRDGRGYESGMGAKRLSETVVKSGLVPEQVITIDTTPLFKGKPGVALYARHWELNNIDPGSALKKATEDAVKQFLNIDPGIRLDNNTNDYLHYGKYLNQQKENPVVSVALEPAVFPYHQKGERVFLSDIRRLINILLDYIREFHR